jgi:uncharacterized membrane protein
MTILILGLIVFFGTHAFTMMREKRAGAIQSLGVNGYRAAYSLVSLIGLVLIIWGYGRYRAGGYIPVFEPPVAMRHLALVLMLPVFPLLFAAYLPGLVKTKAQHPMLAAVKIWALAHLLANGDMGSLLMFLAFLAWAVVARIAAKHRSEDVPGAGGVALASGWTGNDTMAVVGGLVAYAIFAYWLHALLIGVPAIGR